MVADGAQILDLLMAEGSSEKGKRRPGTAFMKPVKPDETLAMIIGGRAYREANRLEEACKLFAQAATRAAELGTPYLRNWAMVNWGAIEAESPESGPAIEETTEQCCIYYTCDDTPRVCLPLAEANGCDEPEDLGDATAVLLCDITQSYGEPFVAGEFCCAEVFCYCGDSGG